jgi:hypothetical protein
MPQRLVLARIVEDMITAAHRRPVMETLPTSPRPLDEHLLEPNSGLGKSIQYLPGHSLSHVSDMSSIPPVIRFHTRQSFGRMKRQ